MGKELLSRLKRLTGGLREESGIGLVEALVAIAILGVGVTAFITDLSVGSVGVNIQSEEVVAQGLAQTQVEVIKNAEYDPTGAAYTPISAPTGYAVSVNTNSAIYSNNNIQKITVTINHSGSDIFTIEDYKVNR